MDNNRLARPNLNLRPGLCLTGPASIRRRPLFEEIRYFILKNLFKYIGKLPLTISHTYGNYQCLICMSILYNTIIVVGYDAMFLLIVIGYETFIYCYKLWL